MPETTPKSRIIAADVPLVMQERLCLYAAAMGRSKSYVLREAIHTWMRQTSEEALVLTVIQKIRSDWTGIISAQAHTAEQLLEAREQFVNKRKELLMSKGVSSELADRILKGFITEDNA